MIKRWLDKGKCALGYHAGSWEWATPEGCEQRQICNRCGVQEMRIAHPFDGWSYSAEGACEQTRACARCHAEESQTVHPWGEASRTNPARCELVSACARCGAQRQEGTLHDWDLWQFEREDACEQRQACARCGEEGPARSVHRWAAWSYREDYGEAVHRCGVCGAEGRRSDFERLEDAAYDAPIARPRESQLLSPALPTERGDEAPAATERMEAWAESARSAGSEREVFAAAIDELRTQVTEAQVSGEQSELQAENSAEILDAIAELVVTPKEAMGDQLDERARSTQLMERMIEVEERVPTQLGEGTRAAQVWPLWSQLVRQVKVEATRIRGSRAMREVAGVFESAAKDLRALEKLADDDLRTFELERERLRPRALALQHRARRSHLTLASPIWKGAAVTTDASAIFFSGRRAIRNLTGRACELSDLTLLPASGSGSRERLRFRQLQQAHVAVFDLAPYDAQQELEHAAMLAPVAYELGIAFALGKPVVILAREAQELPIDVDIEPVLLRGDAEDAKHLATALDATLYALQRESEGSALPSTLAEAMRRLDAAPASADNRAILRELEGECSDPGERAAGLIDAAIGELGEQDLIPLLPVFPGAYPDSEAPRCFHVTAYRPWLKHAEEILRRCCTEHKIEFVHGEEALNPDLMRAIWDDICRATHIVSDLSGLNWNAVMETGMAHALGRNTLLVGREVEGIEPKLPALRHRRMHFYREDGSGLREALDAFLTK